jgi:rhodanese-related sulfurtransferase
MVKHPALKQLSNLVPLNEVDESERDALRSYAQLVSLKPNELLVMRPDESVFYLLSGAFQPEKSDGSAGEIRNAEDWQAFEPNHALPAVRRAHAGAAGAELVRIDRGRLGTLLAWSELRAGNNASALPNEWLPAILRSELLARLPGETLQAAMTRAVATRVAKHERLVSEGDPGDDYFLIVEGEFSAHRETGSGLSLLIAQMYPGDSFGEEALLTNTPRNASVEADTAGTVLRLGKEDFIAFVSGEVGSSISPEAALTALADGALCLDVRTSDEFAHDGREGARNIPLLELRDARDTLKDNRRYVVLCDSGRRAAAATFLMGQWGLDAASVSGGMVALASAKRPGSEDRPNLDDLGHVLDTVDDALEQALHEQATLPELAPVEPGEEDRTDPNLRTRINSARKQIDDAQAVKLALESRIRDLRARMQRDATEALHLRAQLTAETSGLLEQERLRLREAYDKATRTIADLRAQKSALASAADKDQQAVDPQSSKDHEALDRRAAEVHQALLKTRDNALARERDIRREQQEREESMTAQIEDRLRKERVRLEAQVAARLTGIQAAEKRLEQFEAERMADKERARARAAGRAAQRQRWREDMQQRIAQASADGGVEGDDEAIRLAEAAASEENQRLKLHQEVAQLLDNERAIAERNEQDARHKLKFIAERDRLARQRATDEEASEADLMSDIESQLGDAGRAAGAQAYNAELTRLVDEASDTGSREKHAAEQALARARVHIAKLKGDIKRDLDKP